MRDHKEALRSIELLVVILILGILMAMTIPRIAGRTPTGPRGRHEDEPP